MTSPSFSGSLQDRVAAILLIAESLSRTFGVAPLAAWSAALECVEVNTDIDVSAFQSLIPAVHSAPRRR